MTFFLWINNSFIQGITTFLLWKKFTWYEINSSILTFIPGNSMWGWPWQKALHLHLFKHLILVHYSPAHYPTFPPSLLFSFTYSNTILPLYRGSSSCTASISVTTVCLLVFTLSKKIYNTTTDYHNSILTNFHTVTTNLCGKYKYM